MMSTGKRLAKRSLLGTKVMVPGQDGRYYAGQIQAVKSYEDSSVDKRYSVKFEDTKRVFEFSEKVIIGPGFGSVSGVQLLPGQVVFVTLNNREMMGKVVRHDFESQDVLIKVQNGGGGVGQEEETVLTKIDEVRLIESRKSARLVTNDTDFSKLADVNISMEKKKKSGGGVIPSCSLSGPSIAIEVPSRSSYVQIEGSRKRRTSENLPDDEEVLSECSAAMLLMKLSCSPHSPNFNFTGSSSLPHTSHLHHQQQNQLSHHNSSYLEQHQHQQQQQHVLMSDDLPSPAGSSSGASSFRSSTPSPPLSTSTTDEGIEKDFVNNMSKATKLIIYQCTFPGCREQCNSVSTIEHHVRKEHLNRPDTEDEDSDHEEEFYYTEIEVVAPMESGSGAPSSRMAALSLADHLDMARPAHEDPGRRRRKYHSQIQKPFAYGHQPQHQRGGGQQQSLLSSSLPNQPISFPSMGSSPGKLILISPPVRSSAAAGGGESKSPVKRVRDGKKCRKVYGLEQRDLWCTQCKWKKACARFGSNATEPLPNTGTGSTAASAAAITSSSLSSTSSSSSTLVTSTVVPTAVVGSSLLMSANTVKALKF